MTTATCLRRARAAELLEDEALVERGGRLRRALGLMYRHPRPYLGYISAIHLGDCLRRVGLDAPDVVRRRLAEHREQLVELPNIDDEIIYHRYR